MSESNMLLQVSSLQTFFKTDEGDVKAVNNVSFELNRGEIFALVGESGSGKSVTSHSILGLLPYPKAYHPNGSIRFDNTELLNAGDNTLRNLRGKRISMIFQEPMTALNPLKTIDKQILECVPGGLKLPKEKQKARVIELLESVKIRDPESKYNVYPHNLSGGQRQRVMIAMAIANTPDLLIADEPTTALDVTVQKEIIELLKDIQSKTNMAILMISHDLRLVNAIADKVAVMKHGEIVESGSSDQVFNNPQHPYTKQLLDQVIHEKNHMPESDQCLLKTNKLSVKFPVGSKGLFKPQAYFQALSDINIELYKGETLGIVGESGSGKSTFANSILKLISSEGSINFKGQEIAELPEKFFRPLRKDIQVVFQDPFASLSPRLTIREIVGEGLIALTGKSLKDCEEKIDTILEKVGLSKEFAHRFPHEFSGGQRQRIAIARALIMKPELVILDEPTSALDRSVQFQVLDMLLSLQREFNLTYLFISHDLALVRDFCHRVAVMQNGQLVEVQDAAKLFSTPEKAYTQSLLNAAYL